MIVGKYKKTGKDKYNVEIDDKKLCLHEDVIVNSNLLYKKNITNNELNDIIEENEYYKLYNKCVNRISNRIRSEYEIQEYIKDYSTEIKRKIIKQLKDNNLINDEIFVKCYINDKLLMSICGPIKIKTELLKHNIDSNIIEKNIMEIDNSIFQEKIDKIINKYVKNNKKYSKEMLKNKIYTYLIVNGYSHDMFKNKVDNISFNNIDLIKKDYNKIFSKYTKKYEGYELKQKIKNALYQKGYSLNEIEKVIEK